MVEALSLTKSQAGLIASANFVGYLVGALQAALHLPGTRRAWLLSGLAANVFCLAAMGLTVSLPLLLLLRLIAGFASAFILIFASALVATVILSSVFVGGTFMGLTALGLVAAREGEGDPRGLALVTASFSAGQILGPSFAGYVYDLTGSFAVPSLSAAAALVVAATLALSIVRR